MLQSMSALYQMVPWKPGTTDMNEDEIAEMAVAGSWKTGVDAMKRLEEDTTAGHARSTPRVLQRPHVDHSQATRLRSPAVAFVNGRMGATAFVQGAARCRTGARSWTASRT